MVSDLNFFTNKGCKIAAFFFLFFKFCKDQEVIQQGSGGYTTSIRRLYNKGQEFIQQGSGGYTYTTRIRRLYNKEQEVMFSDAIIEPLQKTFAHKGCKITAQKKFVFLRVLPY